ncbi:hypothetical protein HK098_006877, partial [Nowakowskiella sp. JEL0407]
MTGNQNLALVCESPVRCSVSLSLPSNANASDVAIVHAEICKSLFSVIPNLPVCPELTKAFRFENDVFFSFPLSSPIQTALSACISSPLDSLYSWQITNDSTTPIIYETHSSTEPISDSCIANTDPTNHAIYSYYSVTKDLHFHQLNYPTRDSQQLERCDDTIKISHTISFPAQFHPTIDIEITNQNNPSAEFLLIIPLDHTLFFDEYEIERLQNEPVCIDTQTGLFEFPAKTKCEASRLGVVELNVYGGSDLEAPNFSSDARGNILFMKFELEMFGTARLSIPFHLRYGSSKIGGGYELLHIAKPWIYRIRKGIQKGHPISPVPLQIPVINKLLHKTYPDLRFSNTKESESNVDQLMDKMNSTYLLPFCEVKWDKTFTDGILVPV